GAEAVVQSVQVEMPGSGTFDANVELDPAGAALANGPRRIGGDRGEPFRVELSRRTWPTPNVIRFVLETHGEGVVRATIGDGVYDPLANWVAPRVERELSEYSVISGTNLLEISVPWTEAELVAYPTNFTKAIAGRQFNQYHWIHVDTLTKIVDETDNDMLRYYR